MSGSWRAGVEGDVLVAGALVDCERDEGGGHLGCVSWRGGIMDGGRGRHLFDRSCKNDCM